LPNNYLDLLLAFLPLLFDSALFHLLDFKLLFDLFFLLSKDGLDIGLNVGTFVGDCVGDLVGLGALEGTVNNDGLDEGSVVGANERLSDGVVLSIRFFVGLSEGYEPHPELPFDFPFPLPQLQLKLGAFDDWGVTWSR